MGAQGAIFATLAIAAAIPAAAQGPAPLAGATPPNPAGCEFHVWPSARFTFANFGLTGGGFMRGATARRDGQSVSNDPIDIATQRALLAEAEPNRLFAQADHRLIIHEEGLPGRTIRATSGRLANSTVPCYAELAVDDVIVQRDIMHGSALRILFHYRDFGAGALPRRSFATWTQTHLAVFPPRQPGQLAEAIAEIREAYRQDLHLFAAAAESATH